MVPLDDLVFPATRGLDATVAMTSVFRQSSRGGDCGAIRLGIPTRFCKRFYSQNSCEEQHYGIPRQAFRVAFKGLDCLSVFVAIASTDRSVPRCRREGALVSDVDFGRGISAVSNSDLPKAVDFAYRTLREWILQGALVAGQGLPEAELALRIGVSRTPLREAIGRLSAEGLVVKERYRKHVVAEFSENDRVEIMELKALIEGRAAGRAATRLDDSQIATLRQLSDRMERAVRELGDEARPIFDDLNREFHGMIWRAADSPRGQRILETALSSPFNVLGRLDATLAQSMERACWYHHEIVSAFEARDPERARAQMVAHELSLITTHFPEKS